MATGSFIRAVTGPSQITVLQGAYVQEVLTDLRVPTEFRTGAAEGVDTVAAYRGLDLWPVARHVLYVPAGHHNFRLSEEWTEERIYCPEARTPADAYRARNAAMVSGIQELVAFVFRASFYRSGEWMTIGIAQRLGVPVAMRVLPRGGEA